MGRLDDFMKLYGGRKSTTKTYRWALREFFKSMYGVAMERMSLDEAVERYFAEPRVKEEDVKQFFSVILDRPPKTIRLLLSCIKTFLVENKVELGEQFWKRLSRRIKGSRAVSQEKVPSNVELRRILTHCSVHGKALFLTLVSSGMRIGEATQLKLEDIRLDMEPVMINIRRQYTKSGDARITFISREAKEALEEWLKIREDYLKTAVARSHFYEKEAEDKRVFPFDVKVAYDQWIGGLDKSKLNGKDLETNRHMIHPHVLRKFFRSNAGRVSVDMAEALMGHSGYLTDVYRKYANPEETLAEFYKQIEPSLEVFGRTGEQFVKLKEETSGLHAVVNNLAVENDKLKQRQKKMEELIGDLQKRLKKYGEIVEPAEIMLKRMGGLPVEMQERLINQLIYQAEVEMYAGKPVKEVDMTKYEKQKKSE